MGPPPYQRHEIFTSSPSGYHNTSSTTTYHNISSPTAYHNTSSPTAYHGAGGLDTNTTFDTIRFDNVRLIENNNNNNNNNKATPQSTREGLGSRLLSSLSNAQPAAAALSRSGSVLHSRARSWAAAYNTSTTPERSPSPTKGTFIDNLFSGESGKVRLGVPTSPVKEKGKDELELEMEYQPVFTERPERPRLRPQGGAGAAAGSGTRSVNASNGTRGVNASNGTRGANTNNATRKASWFTRKSTTPAMRVVNVDDEMWNLNINTALFPHGPADPLSPQAFNDLLLNATNLIQRMQAAYKEKVDYLASIQPEIDAQKEEVEEANTRSEHLKMQLEDTARQAQEQRGVNEELMLKLTEEKMKVQRLQEAHASTIRLVRHTDAESTTADDDAAFVDTHKRRSRGSASDSGFESDADTASILSSGLDTTPTSHTYPPRLAVQTSPLDGRVDLRSVPSRASALSQQSTAFSRNEGVAWATVERLRNENSDLQKRVQGLERGYDGVLEFVEALRDR